MLHWISLKCNGFFIDNFITMPKFWCWFFPCLWMSYFSSWMEQSVQSEWISMIKSKSFHIYITSHQSMNKINNNHFWIKGRTPKYSLFDFSLLSWKSYKDQKILGWRKIFVLCYTSGFATTHAVVFL